MIKQHLLHYGVAYLNWDVDLPETGSFKVQLFPFFTTINWSNLRADPIIVDLDKFNFNFTTMGEGEENIIYFSMPMVESWRLYFDYDFWYIFHFTGSMSIDLRELDFECSMTLKATERGQLYPTLKDLKVNLTKSMLYHADWFSEWFFRQYFDIFKHILQFGVNIFGKDIFNKDLFIVTRDILQDQIHEFPLSMPTIGKNNTFNVNWRMTADPDIHDGMLDLSLFFDIGPEQSRCLEDDFTHDYYFQEKYGEKYLQFVMSDRVPNCMLAAMERQDWFKFMINS